MTWRIEFYNERRGIVAHYRIDAPSPTRAVLLGREELLVDHPVAPARGSPSLFERAERVGGQDGSGWVLYRIAKDNGDGDGWRQSQSPPHSPPGHVG